MWTETTNFGGLPSSTCSALRVSHKVNLRSLLHHPLPNPCRLDTAHLHPFAQHFQPTKMAGKVPSWPSRFRRMTLGELRFAKHMEKDLHLRYFFACFIGTYIDPGTNNPTSSECFNKKTHIDSIPMTKTSLIKQDLKQKMARGLCLNIPRATVETYLTTMILNILSVFLNSFRTMSLAQKGTLLSSKTPPWIKTGSYQKPFQSLPRIMSDWTSSRLLWRSWMIVFGDLLKFILRQIFDFRRNVLWGYAWVILRHTQGESIKIDTFLIKKPITRRKTWEFNVANRPQKNEHHIPYDSWNIYLHLAEKKHDGKLVGKYTSPMDP